VIYTVSVESFKGMFRVCSFTNFFCAIFSNVDSVQFSSSIMAISMQFHYGNPFCQKGKDSIPIFLRCRGVKGSLSISYPVESVDKIKIVLKGNH
jgi:hypothetical protein